MIKIIRQMEEIIDFAWELSSNVLYASYPRLESMEELKNYIERAIQSETQKVMAYYEDDVLCGLCIYFWQRDEKYAQTTAFLIKENYDQIADAFLNYIGNKLPRYELFIGVPATNENANQYFKRRNIDCVESSIVTMLRNFKLDTIQESKQIERITEDNFGEYALFHDQYAIPLEMYYNSDNLKKDMAYFRVFVLRENNKFKGSIFVKIAKGLSEVFGLFVDNPHKGMEETLIEEMLMELYNEFGEVKEILYFIDEDSKEELKAALKLGFEVKEAYKGYRYIL